MENGKNVRHTSRHCGRGPAIQAVNKENNFHKRLDPGSMSGMTTQKAFTLVELLVVVLIIGILSAIALPMYQGAVDKSHWSTMLPGAKAIKDAEEAIKMTNGAYTDEMANLDVTMNNADLTFDLVTPNNTADPNVIRVTNSKLANVRLASYLDDNPKFAGQLHCEAKTGDERANRLCGKLLMGQELTEQDGYVGYLLDQEITKDICGNASRSWSSSKTKCYKTTAERCETLGMGVVADMDDQCGYANTSGQEILAEGVCKGTTMFGCAGSKIRQGGTCLGMANPACLDSQVFNGGVCQAEIARACQGAKIYDGGKCIGNTGAGCHATQVYNGGECVAKVSTACSLAHIYGGGKCIAETENGCPESVIYDGTGCCEDYGKGFCPASAPKC